MLTGFAGLLLAVDLGASCLVKEIRESIAMAWLAFACCPIGASDCWQRLVLAGLVTFLGLEAAALERHWASASGLVRNLCTAEASFRFA